MSEVTNNEVFNFEVEITYCKYYDSESNWGVFCFSTEDDIPYFIEQKLNPFDDPSKITTKKKFSTLAGKMQELVIGGKYTVKATYRHDKNYGDQYVPVAVYAVAPQTEEDQVIFLKSIMAESIADNLVKAYPNIVNDVMLGNVKEIDYNKVKGMGKFTWERTRDTIINNFLISDIIIMLKPLGVTFNMIKRLLDEEPNPVLLKQKLEENPYYATMIKGLGFKRVDALALKLKPEMHDSIERLVAYINYYLRELGDNDGNTWVSKDILKDVVSNNVADCTDKFDWLLENNDFLHVEDNKVGLKHYYDIEERILTLLLSKVKYGLGFQLDKEKCDKGIKIAEEEQGFEYTDEQKKVIYHTLLRPVSIISGKAGTGKTSIVRGIIKAFLQNNRSVSACALSAMAAKRITEASGYPAMTIHRTLGCMGINKFTFNKDNKMVTDVAFMDEASMTNARLFLDWLEAIGDNTRIIISGDHKQLPPIGYGNIFSDIINFFDNKVSDKLTKPMRQALKSGILTDANMIRENRNPINTDFEPKTVHGELKDMYYMFRTNRQSLFDIATKTYLKTVEEEGVENVVLIVPRKSDCLNSTYELNNYIQDHLLADVKEQISNNVMTFKLGARVMQIVNDYDNNVFNGEIGYIKDIDKKKEGNKVIEFCTVVYTDSDGKQKFVDYEKKDLINLNLAYALTCHKCQGSGYKTVIGIIDNTHYALLDNCMLYTMLTRAKKRCLLLAEPQAFLQCIRTSSNKRNTWLSLKK